MKNRQIQRSGALIALIVIAAVSVSGCDREEYDPTTAVAVDEPRSTSHNYSMRLADSEVEVGETRELQVEVRPSAELKINLDFPWEVRFDHNSGLDLESLEIDMEAMEVSEERVLIPVTIAATEADEYELRGRADFSVCNDDICHIYSNEAVEFLVQAR